MYSAIRSLLKQVNLHDMAINSHTTLINEQNEAINSLNKEIESVTNKIKDTTEEIVLFKKSFEEYRYESTKTINLLQYKIGVLESQILVGEKEKNNLLTDLIIKIKEDLESLLEDTIENSICGHNKKTKILVSSVINSIDLALKPSN